MPDTHTLTNYDANAVDFDWFRQPSPVIVKILQDAFEGVDGSILSIGCGTGQYEAILTQKFRIVGLDKSQGMIAKAKKRFPNVIHADMTVMPLAAGSFSGAYFMQSLHHVGANLTLNTEQRSAARVKALQEAIRVVHQGKIFIVQRDPSQNRAVWFWKYFPEAVETKMMIQPKITSLVRWLKELGLDNVRAKPIQDPMIRDFYDPGAPLDPGFRRSFSDFSYLTEKQMRAGVESLKIAIQDGSVQDEIARCKLRFSEIGGTVFVVSGKKR